MMLLILIFIILTVGIYIFYRSMYANDNLVLTKSDIDQKYYLVRNRHDKELASNTLARISSNIEKLVAHLKTNVDIFPDYTSYIKDLVSRTKKINIMETPEDEKYTSYTVNKGERIVFCLRYKVIEQIHDMNTLMYVVIHELAHVGCPEYGHTKLFNKIFKFLLEQGIVIGIYTPVNYRINPQNYCGMEINEYIL